MADKGYQPFPDISAWTAVPFDPTTYDQYAALLEQARAEATEEAREHAVRTAMRYAGTDTGAIEGLYTTDRGFTRTVAIEAAGWETAANERGPNAAAIIKDQIEAYEWVLDLVTQKVPVTEHVIRELHAMLCRSQDTYVVHTEVGTQERPLPKGEYKKFPNNPTSLATGRLHHYAPPDMVAPEMARLVTSLSSDEYLAAHPVVQAAYLHYSLAAIHPFADGNGRVSRALGSIPLYRALRLPLVVLRDERDEYLDSLAKADGGDIGALTAFINGRVIATAGLVSTTTTLGTDADRARSLAELSDLAIGSHGLSMGRLRAASMTVLDELKQQFRDQIDGPEWPSTLTGGSTEEFGGNYTGTVPPGFTVVEDDFNLREYSLANASPGHPSISFQVCIAIRVSTTGAALACLTSLDDIVSLTVDASEVYPQPRDSLRIKLRHWSERVLDVALQKLAAQAREAAQRESGPN